MYDFKLFNKIIKMVKQNSHFYKCLTKKLIFKTIVKSLASETFLKKVPENALF